MYTGMDQPDLQFSPKTVMGKIARPAARFRKFSRYLEDERVLEYLDGKHSEVAGSMAFGDSDWPGNREWRRSTTAVLEKLGNHFIEGVSRS